MASQRSESVSEPPFSLTAWARCLWPFSTITMAPSTIVPMVIAMPPKDMILAFSPWNRITINAMRIPSGKVMIATKAERTCNRNSTTTRLTITSSCIKEVFKPSTALSMRSPRS